MRGAFAFLSPVIHPAAQPRKDLSMFFPFLAASIVGAGAMKLGALSVTVSILTIALQALILANLLGAGYLLWRRWQD